MDLDAREMEKLSCRRRTIYACHGLSIGFSVIMIIANVLLIVIGTYLNLVYIGCACGGASIFVSCVDILITKYHRESKCRVFRILIYCLEMFLILGCGVYTGLSFSWHYFGKDDGSGPRLTLTDESFRVGGRRTEKLIMHYLIMASVVFLFLLIMIKLCCIGSIANVERKNTVRMRNAYEQSSSSRTNEERVSAQSRWTGQADSLMQPQVFYQAPSSTVSYVQPTAPPRGHQHLYNPTYVAQDNPPSYEEAMRE